MRYPKQGEKYNVEVFNDNFREVKKTLSQKSGMIVTEHSGAMILANGTAAAPIQGLSVFGKSEQLSTTGAQLAIFPDIENTVQGGISWSCKGGVVTAKGTATGTNSSIPLGIYYDIPVVPKTYFISGNSTDGVKVWVKIIRSDGTISYKTSQMFVLDGTEQYATVYCQVDAGLTVNATVYPMLNAGDTALPWEPYTGGKTSPNPDYPQEVVSPGDAGSLEIGVYGGNLWNVSARGENAVYTNNGITFTVDSNTGTIRAVGTNESSSNTYFIYSNNFVKLANGKYTLHGHCSDYTNALAQCWNHKGDSRISFDKGNGVTFDFTNEDGSYNVAVGVVGGATVDITFQPMLNAGDTALPWEPYTKQSASIAVTGGLPAIPVDSGGLWTDENGQQWVGDYIDVERGVRVHNVGVVDFNGLVCVMNEMSVDSGLYRFEFRYADNPNIAPSAIAYGTTGYCTALSYRFNPLGYNDVDNAIAVYNKGGFYARCDQFETADDFLAHMQSIDAKVYYILAEPYETELSAEEIEAFLDLRTNKPVTTIMNDAGAYMEAELVADTKLYIDAKIEELKAALGG